MTASIGGEGERWTDVLRHGDSEFECWYRSGWRLVLACETRPDMRIEVGILDANGRVLAGGER